MYRVTGAGGLSVGLTAEGATAEEAIERLAERIRARVNAGTKLTISIMHVGDWSV